ncbi:hypothetical protein [Bradyrhizobium diazoefficiens]
MNVLLGQRGHDMIAEGTDVTILPLPPGTKKPIRVSTAIDSISAAGTRRATSTGVSRRPNSVNSTGGLRSDPIAM